MNQNQPTVRLAHVDGAQGDGALQGTNGFQVDKQDAPALLVSYYYLEPFLKNQRRYRYRDWVMDSGAFSAENSGKKINLQKYIDCCLKLMAEDPTLTEVFALDVIGDAEASLRNCEEMWRQGVPAIPTFHQQEPEEFLVQMAKDYPKIALGGVALERGDFKLAWLEQCFARVWPKKIHGFGMSSEAIIFGLPFHSVDATNWEIAPCAFGNWQKFGKMSVRGSNQDLCSQVKYYLELEAKARVKWKKEMALLDSLPEVKPALTASPVVRLAMRSTGRELEVAMSLSPASSASRTAGACALDAGAAGGNRQPAAIGENKFSLSTPAKKQKTGAEQEAEEQKWKDYWANRGLHRDPKADIQT